MYSFTNAGGRLSSTVGNLIYGLFVEIECNNIMSGFDKVEGHASPHVSETYKCNSGHTGLLCANTCDYVPSGVTLAAQASPSPLASAHMARQ